MTDRAEIDKLLERLTARERYVQSRLDGEERHREEDVAALWDKVANLERRLAGDRTPMPPVWADHQAMCTLHWILAQMRVLRGEE